MDRYHEVCTARESIHLARIAALEEELATWQNGCICTDTTRSMNAAKISRATRLERFICHEGGLVNDWARSCPYGTKLTDYIKGELNAYLKRNP